MEPIFNEKMIRDELRRIDKKTGYNAADLPIKFGDAKSYLGKFIYGDNMSFYFSNYFFVIQILHLRKSWIQYAMNMHII